MKINSLIVLSGLILSTAAAQADCFLDRASSYQCHFPQEITCSLNADPVRGIGQKILKLKYDDHGKVQYSYSAWAPGKCPSRNCGADVEYTYEGSSEEAGKTGSVKNYNDHQLVASLAGTDGLEFLMVLNHPIPTGLKARIPMKLQAMQVQDLYVTGNGTDWYCQ